MIEFLKRVIFKAAVCMQISNYIATKKIDAMDGRLDVIEEEADKEGNQALIRPFIIKKLIFSQFNPKQAKKDNKDAA